MLKSHACMGSLLLFLTVMASPGRCQEAAKPEEAKIPEPREVELDTKDGVILQCTYFPSNKGKKAVPLILLHGYGGAQQDLVNLAKTLQENQHAVLIGDLRGHGGSTKLRLPNGDQRDLDHSTMKFDEFKSLVYDVEAMKSFLLEENNKGKVNIELLCVVGTELGAVLALNWAVLDWSWQQLPAYKQGKDVKALVLVSPKQSIKGLSVSGPLRHPDVRERLSLMILCGAQGRAYADARRINNSFKRFHPTPPKDERADRQDLFFIEPDTSLQGAELLDAEGLGLHRKIVGFIKLRLVNQEDRHPWRERKSPLGGS